MPRIRAENIAAHRELTRRQILDAAGELFVTYGYGDTSFGDIAAEVGVGRTTVYEYFPDKEEVLVHLVEATIPDHIAGLIESLPEGLTCRDRLGELIIRNLEFVADDRNLGTLIMREGPQLKPEARMRVGIAHQQLESEIVAICKDAVAAGEFRAIDPMWAARIVNTMMMGASRALLGDEHAKQHIHEVADTFLEVLFEGLAG